ncbi:MAG: hypothetical protein ACOY94_08405 [Bacillota bacterium]
MNREQMHTLVDLMLELRGALLPKPPQEAMAHFRNARREGLLGVRALVDHALERLEAEEQQAARQDRSKPIPLE